MTSILSMLSASSSACRPSPDEIEAYAGLIALHDRRGRKSPAHYRREAEMQIWVSRWWAARHPDDQDSNGPMAAAH